MKRLLSRQAPNADAQSLATPRVRSALFEIAFRPSAQAARWMLWGISVWFALLALWAIVAKLDIVAVAPGRLVPQSYLKIVQPAVFGNVRELLVLYLIHLSDPTEPYQISSAVFSL